MALSTGKAQLGDAETGNVKEKKCDCIGWVSDQYVFLDPNVSFGAVQKLAQEQGESLMVSQKTLWQRLRDRGLLPLSDADRNLLRTTIGKQRRRVVALLPKTLGYSTGERDQRDIRD